jgi:hypothetical protein
LTTLPVQGKDSNAALPLHPHPAAVFPTSVYHGRGRYKQSALSVQPKQDIQASHRIATLCRPNSRNEKTRLKLGRVGRLKNTKKELRPVGDRSVEWHFGFCFQQNVYGGVGLWLRDAGRGL